MKSVRSKLLMILLVCMLVSATSLVTGCKSVYSGGPMSLRAAPGTTVATASPAPANPRDRILGPARKVVAEHPHAVLAGALAPPLGRRRSACELKHAQSIAAIACAPLRDACDGRLLFPPGRKKP